MKRITGSIVFLLIITLLAGCSVPLAQGGAQPTVTPTDCGCSIEDILTPTGGIDAPAPAGPAAPTVAPETLKDQWKTYTDAAHGFSFEFPAVYESPEFAFCAAREASAPPEDSLFALSLGSRTSLVLVDAAGKDLPAVVDAYRSDPAHQDYQFDAPVERTVGGSPALVLPYRSGGTSRYAEAVFFIHAGTLYRVDTGTPSACDVPALNLKELDAYSRLLYTFQFTQ
jgi:hypothetical protein